ncbi:MAG: transcription antitermination factor NusB [Gemmataceae bacterium]|jgi:N utilization substance protein B
MITKRTKAREVALQLLYRSDLNPKLSEKQVREFIDARLLDLKSREFAKLLYTSTKELQPQLDETLAKSTDNWKLPRMAAVDRNLLRLGAYELAHQKETPVEVILNESIELARRFGTSDSPAFINGILDKVRQTERPS